MFLKYLHLFNFESFLFYLFKFIFIDLESHIVWRSVSLALTIPRRWFCYRWGLFQFIYIVLVTIMRVIVTSPRTLWIPTWTLFNEIQPLSTLIIDSNALYFRLECKIEVWSPRWWAFWFVKLWFLLILMLCSTLIYKTLIFILKDRKVLVKEFVLFC